MVDCCVFSCLQTYSLLVLDAVEIKNSKIGYRRARVFIMEGVVDSQR